ncbi:MULTISPECIES: M14 family zinc carboxypeptidase [unclassified Sedimentibacter]|uniref:M14 family zinc carboxypeptidase n=1 Tax=unclassified Sedimentibacter TaxID=2649220 RepID=UPI0027E09A0D|nr:M14 family zinc carboxypeptidase [Sedimentibacter sp. MB35-C1]WMJ78066.1 M14 family zinc carboxypeptidase [Sedimentibacter sp. MB35-C1]
MNKHIVDTSDTYYLDRIYGDIDELCGIYSDILSKEIIGKSVEGRDIAALKLSSGKGRTSVLLAGGIHAREDFSVMLCMKMLDYYCYYYKEDKNFGEYDVKKIIDNVDMYFIPVVNPDGLNIVHNGLKASSNYNALKKMKIWGEDHTYWKANANGVDLNKNFDDGNWEIRTCVPGTHVPCSDRFKGFAPGSEPETQALTDFCSRHSFSLMATYHCSGNCTFWADSGTHGMFSGIDEKIMNELNKKYIYRKTKISQDPKVYGCGFENWFRAKMKRPGFCIELSPFVEGGKQHPDYMFDELVWQHAGTTGLFFAEKALYVHDEIYGDAERYAALTKEEILR